MPPALNGSAASARIVGMGGAEVFSCSVADENSNAVIKRHHDESRGHPGADRLVPAENAIKEDHND